ncbi:MAG: hypothetical protein J6W53_00725 [Candidatus Methanomethylophilaceae archaeon]|nr:hypothetical protein [Candidatus Methanomethylophilaceae archaeon]
MKREPSEDVCRCPRCGMVFRMGTEDRHLTDRLCLVCGHAWKSRGRTLPRRCPKCRSTRWNARVREELECLRCHHRWVPRGAGVPMNCPRCKSMYWREERQEPAAVTDDLLQKAASMYSEGKGCLEIAMLLDIPLEDVVLEIRSVREGFVRIS